MFTVARSHPDGTTLFLDHRPIWGGAAFHWSASPDDAAQFSLTEANDLAHLWNRRPDALRTEWLARVERVGTVVERISA